MLNSFIRIRLFQIWRSIVGIGFFRAIFLLALISFGFRFLFEQTSCLPNAYFITLGHLLIILQLHLKRKDKKFLRSSFYNYRLIYLVEYILLSTPLLLFLVYNFQWLIFIILTISLLAIIRVDFTYQQKVLNTKIQRLIPDTCFEWKAGLRKVFLFLFPVWIIGFLTSYYIWGVPVILFVLGFIIVDFYGKNEPLQMLLVYERSTTRFLFHKIRLQVILFTLLALPLMLLFVIFHVDSWYIVIIEYVIFTFYYIYLIMAKYAYYDPNCDSSGSSKIFGAFGAISIFIPVFIPVIWILTFYFYFKSMNNLNFYLNDYN